MTSTAGAPTLTRWFALIDSDHPEGILDLIAPDFRFSIVFGTGAGQATDFAGRREALEGYLRQREKGVLTHHVVSASVDGHDELVLGETRRGEVFESTFVAAARLGTGGAVRNLMIGRSPMLELHESD
ncbi:nuclear transport factor 2 family protein [Saccharopolyspora sp. NFXS83]|uniref:nuclear transport factor 2 family protein n=1 Tax=Saccharopolyspora sp. NFXS83 TaxID=2993560 RepID=UPI00224A964B|nr:nuclear transport factor 2 family protein [Saccharopolyspora sp. NFXS83]MCX2729134.1 nuclear transport factor 2 family protein [Saccharopolyspora sp. NFXS83]